MNEKPKEKHVFVEGDDCCLLFRNHIFGENKKKLSRRTHTNAHP